MILQGVYLLTALAGAVACGLISDELISDEFQERRIEALAEIGFCVGAWQGAAQPQRGSSRGAFAEQLDVQWRFAEDSTQLQLDFRSGRPITQLVIVSSDSGQHISAVLQQQDSQSLLMPAEMADSRRTAKSDQVSRWVFTSQQDQLPGLRVTLQRISEIRLLLLVEQQQQRSLPWQRIMEYGMTRKGHRLAGDGRQFRECLITGGQGAIEVRHAGKSWFVCCQGCRQVFDEDPAAAVAAYERKVSAQKSKVGTATGRQ